MSGSAGPLPINAERYECIIMHHHDPWWEGTSSFSCYSYNMIFQLAPKGLRMPGWNSETMSANSAPCPRPIAYASGTPNFNNLQPLAPKRGFQNIALMHTKVGKNSTYLFELRLPMVAQEPIHSFQYTRTRLPNPPSQPFSMQIQDGPLPLSFLQHLRTAVLSVQVIGDC